MTSFATVVLAAVVAVAAASPGRFVAPNLSQLFMTRDDFCPEWSPWTDSQCFWPDTTYEQALDAACRPEQPLTGVPQWFNNFVSGNGGRAIFEKEAYEYQSRGAPQRCGYCSRTLSCRSRQLQSGQTMPDYCKLREWKTNWDAQCPGTAPCELTMVEGECRPPAFTYSIEFMRAVTAHHKGKGKGKGKGHGGGHGGGHGSGEMMMPPPRGKGPDGEMSARELHHAVMYLGEKVERTMLAVFAIRNGTNCVMDATSQRCMCCCGPYVPDVQSRQCRDVTPFMPKVKTIVSDLMSRHKDDMRRRRKRVAPDFVHEHLETFVPMFERALDAE